MCLGMGGGVRGQKTEGLDSFASQRTCAQVLIQDLRHVLVRVVLRAGQNPRVHRLEVIGALAVGSLLVRLQAPDGIQKLSTRDYILSRASVRKRKGTKEERQKTKGRGEKVETLYTPLVQIVGDVDTLLVQIRGRVLLRVGRELSHHVPVVQSLACIRFQCERKRQIKCS